MKKQELVRLKTIQNPPTPRTGRLTVGRKINFTSGPVSETLFLSFLEYQTINKEQNPVILMQSGPYWFVEVGWW
jgi:hypothetical protein